MKEEGAKKHEKLRDAEQTSGIFMKRSLLLNACAVDHLP